MILVRPGTPAASVTATSTCAACPRFVVLGDAMCTFNPIYGQGMTVAAAEALVLRDCLRRGTQRLGRRFARRAAKVVDIPWDIAVGGDCASPASTDDGH